MLALLLSLFVVGAILGTVFSHTRAGRETIARAKQRLRALIFGWEFPPFNSGGLGVACMGLTRSLADKDVDVTFVLPKRFPIKVPYATMLAATDFEDAKKGKLGMHIRIVEADAAAVAASAYPSAKAADGTPLYGSIESETERYARAAANIARKVPHDVIYAHDWLTFGAGCAAKRVSGKPLLAHVHATEFDRGGGENVNQYVYDIERRGMHEADRVIAVSHRTKDVAVDRYGVAPEKTRVVWNGIDDTTAPAYDESRAPRLEALSRAGHKLVLFAGRLTIQKGADYFLRAAAKVAKDEPDALFIVAGSGDMERELMRMAAGLGIGDRVLFPGFLRDHDLHEVYEAADVYVMPSVSEPFGITALEALRVGTPVILSKQSGVAEAVPEAAVQVDFWDVDALARAIETELTASADVRTAKVARGRKAAARLSWDRAGSEVRSIMDELALSGI